MRYLLMLVPALVLLASCGGDGEPVEAEEGNGNGEVAQDEEYILPEADMYLTVADSIGVEIGDSNYVFGQITGVDISPVTGEMAVLDIQKLAVLVYDGEGEFVRSVGRQGSGPGEFQLPVGMTYLPSGGMVISDAMGGKMIRYDSTYQYDSDVIGFFPSPPAVVAGIEGGVVGMKPEFEQTDEEMYMGFTVARWPWGQAEPDVVYYTAMSPFDPTDMSSMGKDVVSFAADPGGTVVTAPMSTEEYRFTAWSPEGEQLFQVVDEDYEMVPKTQEEIDLERELVNARMVQQGMPAEMANWEPDPYRVAIAGLYMDARGRIWVYRGDTMTAVFDVYDMQGEKLFTAALDAGERAETWMTMIIEERFVAFDANPEDYPRLYVGGLPGMEPEDPGTEQGGETMPSPDAPE